jgi:hypothetical protein
MVKLCGSAREVTGSVSDKVGHVAVSHDPSNCFVSEMMSATELEEYQSMRRNMPQFVLIYGRQRRYTGLLVTLFIRCSVGLDINTTHDIPRKAAMLNKYLE